MEKNPLIGLTMSFDSKGVYYSELPWYVLRENHCSTVIAAGGTPIGLPYDVSSVDQYLNTIDGLIVTGSNFDLSPQYYGESISKECILSTDPVDCRTQFELDMLKKALERNMPILGICAGQQLLNVVLGGSLIQHIPDVLPSEIQHEQPGSRTVAGHTVNVVKDTLLSRCVNGQPVLDVNSAHHQAVEAIGPGVVVNAYASDGLIEGIEHPSYKFCMGVQWHPEFSISPADDMITKSLIDASRS